MPGFFGYFFNGVEIIGTVAFAASGAMLAIDRDLDLFGVLLLGVLQPILESPVLEPAFDNILPALFGGLGVVYISKNWKIAVAPLAFMVVLFLLVPELSSSVGVLVPVGALVCIGVSRILYKKGIIK